MGNDNTFSFGIEALDELFKGALVPGTTLLIAGHPGAGKTTFSATICYKNALMGKPCLYLSFQESKEKFFRQMEKYNMNFRELEGKKAFKFVRLPIVATDEIINVLSEVIGSSLKEIDARLLVLDSATPISETLESARVGRSIFQNFFYDLSKAINGLVVIVEELPLGQTSLANADLEFIADAVILMKHQIKESLLVRTMEFRKFRGAPLTVAEVPFSIRSGEGLSVFIPKKLESVPPTNKERAIRLPCKALERSVHEIYPGMTILITAPAYARSFLYEVLPIVALSIINELSLGVISYKYSSNELRDFILEAAETFGVPGELVVKAVKFYEGINPTAFSLEELVHLEHTIIRERKPDMVVFHGSEQILFGFEDVSNFYKLLYNELLNLRAAGVLVVRMVSYVDEASFIAQAAQSDVVMKIDYVRRRERGYVSNPLEPELFVWRTGYEPRLLYGNTLQECFKEMRQNVRAKLRIKEGNDGEL